MREFTSEQNVFLTVKMPYKMVTTFESVDSDIPKCNHSNESSLAVFHDDEAVCLDTFSLNTKLDNFA